MKTSILLVAFTFACALLRGAENPQNAIQMEKVVVLAGAIDAAIGYNDEGRVSLVLITQVRDKTAAHRAGLRPGMLLFSIQGKYLPGKTREEFAQVLQTPVATEHVFDIRRIVPKNARVYDFALGGQLFGNIETVRIPIPRLKDSQVASAR